MVTWTVLLDFIYLSFVISSTGSGFANSRKSKFIKKYNKLKKRTKEKNASSEFILKPLASDPLRKDDAEETLLLSQSRY